MKFKELQVITGLFVLMLTTPLFAQDAPKPADEFKPSGKLEGRIYADAYSVITSPTLETSPYYMKSKTGAELKRAYLGYTYQFLPEWSGKLLLDISNDAIGVDRQVYFKTAAVYYKKGALSAAAGIHDTYNFRLSEKIWGKRYVVLPYQDQFKYYTSADLGLSGEYTFGHFTADLSVFNGEGFRRVQTDNAYRYGLGVTGKFMSNKLSVRLFGDYLSTSYQQSTLSFFTGYQVDNKLAVGVEADFQYHPDYMTPTITTSVTGKADTTGVVTGEAKLKYSAPVARDKNRFGGSAFAVYYVTSKVNIFGRLDYHQSTSFNSNVDSWAETKLIDGTQYIAGVEYVLSKNLRFAADYQCFDPQMKNYNPNAEKSSTTSLNRVFFHLEASF